MLDRRPYGQSRNARTGRCSDCHRRLEVYEIDGTNDAICLACIRGQVEVASELLDTAELYEGSTSADWLEFHGRHREPVIGCPYCSVRFR